ncbi:hypothetical protein [Methylocystis sp. S23]
MDNRDIDRSPAREAKPVSARDLAIVLFAIAAVVFANLGVVRALDAALDTIHR